MEQMDGLMLSAQNDSTVDKKFLAKNALQLKLATAFDYSLDDYESFTSFTKKYGEALEHLIEENEDITIHILNEVTKNPDADLGKSEIERIKALLALPVYSKYLH